MRTATRIYQCETFPNGEIDIINGFPYVFSDRKHIPESFFRYDTAYEAATSICLWVGFGVSITYKDNGEIVLEGYRQPSLRKNSDPLHVLSLIANAHTFTIEFFPAYIPIIKSITLVPAHPFLVPCDIAKTKEEIIDAMNSE